MTFTEKFLYEREAIAAALRTAGIADVQFNKDDIPKNLPCAIVILDTETGKLGTTRRFTATDLDFTVFLVVNAHANPDPDADIYALKEAFRTAYMAALGRDLPKVDYYTSRLDGARLVRIAKIDLLRSGFGAAQ